MEVYLYTCKPAYRSPNILIQSGPKVTHQQENWISPSIVWEKGLIFSPIIRVYSNFIFIKACLDKSTLKQIFWLKRKNFAVSYTKNN
jgi:hypothetical protein